MNINSKKGIASILVTAITIGLFFANIVRIGDEIGSVRAANYGTQTEVGSETVGWVTSYSVSDAISNTVGTVGSSSQTANYSVAGQSGWMCIQSGSSSPNGSSGTVYRCVNTAEFSNDSYLRALSGLTYSQIAVAAYRYASSNPNDNWCVAHTILSYILSGDGVWYGAVANSRTGGWLSSAASAIRTYASGVSGDASFYVCVVNGHQNVISLTYTPRPVTGKVRINKIDNTGNGVVGAVISLTSVSGADTSSLHVVSGASDGHSISNGIEFTTTGVPVEIQGLEPESSYQFYEVSAPLGYNLAQPRTVQFVTDANGNPSVSGQPDWDAATYTYTMTDYVVLRGSVSFKKVEQRTDGSIYKLSQAVIEFRSSDGRDISDAVVTMGSGTLVEHTSSYIRFVTGAGDDIDIEIANLEAGRYFFEEVGTPQGYATADNITVTVNTDGTCSPSSVTMIDRFNPPNEGDYGSFSLVKVFDTGVDGTLTGPNGFFNSVNYINFRMLGPFSEDYIENNPQNLDPHNGNTMYGAQELASAGGGPSNVTWNSELNRYEFPVCWTIHGEGGFPGVDIDYHQYYDWATGWHTWRANQASYIVGLPRGSYFLVTERWNDGMISDEANQIFVNSANLSPYWVELPSSSGEHLYALLFYVGQDGVTYVCHWAADENVGMINRTARALQVVNGHDVPIYQDYFEGSVENGTRVGALALNKIDETGTGVEGVRFELHRVGTGSGYVIANGHISANRGSFTNSDGYTEYPVDWNFTMTTYDDNRRWIEYDEPHQVSWDPRTGPVYEYGYIVGQWEYTQHAITDAAFVYNLNYGDYYIYEFIEDEDGNNLIGGYRVPDGWEAVDSNSDGTTDYFRKLVTVDSSSHASPVQVSVANRENVLHVEVCKIDESTGSILSDYDGNSLLAFNLYFDSNNNGQVDGSDILVGSGSDTDRDGIVDFNYSLSEMPEGVPNSPDEYPAAFLVVETSAPDGYYLNQNPIRVNISPDEGLAATVNCVDTPYIRLSFGVDKIDQWTGSVLTDYEGGYDAQFELWVDVDDDGLINENTDRLIDTLTDDDRNGRVDVTYYLTPAVIAEKFPECYVPGTSQITGQSSRNYPVDYLVREVQAPLGFYLNNSVYQVSLNGGEYEETAERIQVCDTPYHTHIRIYKFDADTGTDISAAQFTVYNDVDGNGVYTENVDTVAQTYSESSGGLSDVMVVWNSSENCYVTSELRAGRYIVVETGLPYGYFYVGSDGQPVLTRNEASVVVDLQDVTVTGFTSPEYELTFRNIRPSIHTTLIDPVTESHTALTGEDIELVDTVTYSNLIPGIEYELTGVLYLKNEGEPLVDEYGNTVTARSCFTPVSPDGTSEVTFHINTQRLIDLAARGDLQTPVDLVAFEYLDISVNANNGYPQWYCDSHVAVHEDITDLGQTVRVGEISTGVYDNQTLSQVASTGPDGDGYAVIIDKVHYEGLAPGRTYTMTGEMHLLTYDTNGNAVDGGVIEAADSRENLHPSTTFIPSEQEGYVEVVYTININRFRGQTMVSFEDCYQDDVHIMWHRDIEDLPQTLFVPQVSTNAYCPDTTPGDMGRTVIGIMQRARIVDEVNYSNLLADGRQYMVQGTLYWMYTDENGFVHSGSMADVIGEDQAVSTMYFTPDEASGTVEMTFAFDSNVLTGLHYDRLVVCETVYSNGGIGWKPVAHHWDFSYENNSQSIYVADIHTTASSSVGNVLPETEYATITDRVFYDNLVPGTSYTVEGCIQFAITDDSGNVIQSSALIIDGEEVRASHTFVPSSSSGYVDLSFTVNVPYVTETGYDKLVVFEELYAGPGVLIALHADINDADQTIDIPDLTSSAHGQAGERSIAPSEDAVIIDTVYYSGLIPGNEYRMETDLMNYSTGESDAHVTTVFVPQSNDGSVDVTISFDASSYTSEKLVVFESVYDNSSGALVKSHCDWEERSQTLTFIPQTGLVYDPVYHDIGCAVASSGAVAGVIWFVLIRRRKEELSC